MDNSEEKKSKLPNIEGYQIEGALSRTKSTVSFRGTSELNRASVQITIASGEAYRASLKPFLDESFPKITKALKLVDHPNIVALLDAGYVQEMPFTVTPLFAAGSLKQFTGKARNWRDVFSIVLPIADALAYCHDHGIIHRDVKPQNVIINDQGDLCLTNFSLLEPTAANKLSVTLTGSGECFPAFIAPEVWNGKCSPAVDQYSFGVMLYELLTTTLPFDASNVVSLLVQQATESITPPSTLVSSIPKTVDAIIEKLLASDPSARFGSMRDLKIAMQDLLKNSDLPRPGETPTDAKTAGKQKNSRQSSRQSPSPIPAEVVQPEKPRRESAALSQQKSAEGKSASANPPKKKSNPLVILMFGILVAVILCAIVFLVGLLTDMGIIPELLDRLGVWISPGSANLFSRDATAFVQATMLAMGGTQIQPSTTPLPNKEYSLVVSSIGGATKTQYYESTSPGNLPKIWNAFNNETELGSKGAVYSLPVRIETSDSLGIKLQAYNGSSISGLIHVYKSSEVEFPENLKPSIHIDLGRLFVSTNGSPICVTSALLPAEEICVRGGQMMVENGRVDVKVWCLEGKCEVYRDGDWVNTILPLTRSTYFNDGGYAVRESNTQVLFDLVDELKQYNLECDSCMSVKVLYPPE